MTLPQLPNAPQDVATRYLCAASYLDPEFRGHVIDMLSRDSLHAVCPSFGVDSVALLRHAVAARRLTYRRDRLLAGIWIVAGAALWAESSMNASRAAATGDVLATLAILAVAAWLISFTHLYELRRRAIALRLPQTNPRAAAAPTDAVIEARLNELATSNLIVYDVAQGDPFVGSGHLMDNWLLKPVNLTLAATDSSGRKKQLVQFSPAELHQFLAKRVPAVGFDNLVARNRLYIRGDAVRSLRDILPDRMGRPEVRAPSDLVKSGANHHRDYARTYLCFERVSNGGQIVVSMFVRARLNNNRLTLESLTYVLPPVKRSLAGLVSELPTNQAFAALAAAAASFRAFPGLLLRAPLSLFGDPHVRARLRYEASAKREISAGVPFDYGAAVSIREAWADYETRDRFKRNDVIDDYQRLRHQLWDCTEEFLEQHGVDTTSFKKEIQVITQQQVTNYSFASVNGTGNYFGGHGLININAGQTQGQPQTPAPTS